ncbi:MAG: ABC transporter permease [Lachnospiraceae bacterium]|nr:ABC transporter permease [Lachnospiraceae bacterium]
MRRWMTWCLLTEKRLIKKISYVAVLLVMPFLVLGLRQGARQEAGMVSIGLYTPAEAGTLSDLVLERFMEEPSVLRFFRYRTEEEALDALKSQRVDAVWILPEDLEKDLQKLAQKKMMRPVARVIEREDDIALIFTREVLTSRIFPEYVYEVYKEFCKSRVGLAELSEEEFLSIYHANLWKGNLFKAQHLDGSELAEQSYVLAPIRGMLAIWLVICGLAGILYHKMDELHGVYDKIPRRKRLLYSFGLQAVVLLNGGVTYLIACKILGVFTSLWAEIAFLLLFLSCIAVFCNLIGLLVKGMEGIGVLIPVLTLLMMVFCPIFLNIRKFWMAQALLPPYLYLNLNGSNGGHYMLPMLLYAAGGLLLCLVVNLIGRKE